MLLLIVSSNDRQHLVVRPEQTHKKDVWFYWQVQNYTWNKDIVGCFIKTIKFVVSFT